ncbi:site-specific integrase [Moritella sp.]|uniref:site-specific integrase n=1 Tax=Moritella sp. TaxID=78556 RepID=UPI001DBC2CA0|nr:site-specific integrase [Moritella sp.]MCJ8349016.1 site-specific integrase [Moritella sp.]NQZ41391.1 site-specific integrase [Moritella sp.]
MNITLSNITQRNHTYYFRQRIPSDLIQYFDQKELYFSLKTKKLNNAISIVSALQYVICDLHKKLRSNSIVERSANLINLIKKSIHSTSVETKLKHSNKSDDPCKAIIESQLLPPLREVAIEGISLGKAVDQFLNSKLNGPKIESKTYSALKSSLSLLNQMFGDKKDIQSINLHDAENFRNLLLKLPANRSKLSKYHGLTLHQIASFGDTPQSLTTVKTTLNKCSAFFSWCIKADLINKNYFHQLPLPKKTGKDSDERAIWSKGDLVRLFSSNVWKYQDYKHSYQYWLPLIGLYTGARLTEIAQLRVEDIKTIDSIKCFHITDAAQDQKLKNPNSMRYIPVHSHLIKLGLLDFVNNQKEGWLFDGLLNKKGEVPRDGLGTNASKWFLYYKNALGIKKPVFHSFRHTVANTFKQNSVLESNAMGILGHKNQSITYARYGKDINVTLLKEIIEVLNFDYISDFNLK